MTKELVLVISAYLELNQTEITKIGHVFIIYHLLRLLELTSILNIDHSFTSWCSCTAQTNLPEASSRSHVRSCCPGKTASHLWRGSGGPQRGGHSASTASSGCSTVAPRRPSLKWTCCSPEGHNRDSRQCWRVIRIYTGMSNFTWHFWISYSSHMGTDWQQNPADLKLKVSMKLEVDVRHRLEHSLDSLGQND